MSILFARRTAAAVVLACVSATAASAHVTLEQREAVSGTSYKAVLKVPHGCGTAATTGLKVTIPEGVLSVKPQPKAGWTLAVENGPYAKPYEVMHGPPATEGVKTIDWYGGDLPNAFYDEFVFVAYLAPQTSPSTLYFPVLQSCGTDSTDWAELPQDGAPRPAHPAPALKLAAAATPAPAPAAAAAAAAAATYKVGDLVVEAPWSRATPNGAKVAGGYVKITNTGKTADKLVGGSFEQSNRFEVHEMAMNNGVMTMRPVKGGLEIAPGQSVMLAPGGFHLMFMDLKQPLKDGETVKGTLVFEKAGTLPVTFDVRGIGASAPAAAGAAPAGAMEHKH